MLGYWTIFSVILTLHLHTGLSSPVCSQDNDCGWNSVCEDGICQCVDGYALGANGKDCVDTYCEDPSCIECLARQVCHRCVNYIEDETGQCADTCDDVYRLVIDGPQVGKVCPGPVNGGIWSSIYVAVIVGVVAAVLLICLLFLACYWRLKSVKERKLRFQVVNKQLEKADKAKTQKQVSEYISFENPAYDSTPDIGRRSHLKMLQDMTVLRANIGTLNHMYTEAKAGANKWPKHKRPGQQYRYIVFHLCRVLNLLHDPDPDLSQDTSRLLQWTIRLQQEYRMLKQNGRYDTMNLSVNEGHAVTPSSSLAQLTSAFQIHPVMDSQSLPPNTLPRLNTNERATVPQLHSPIMAYEEIDRGSFDPDVVPRMTSATLPTRGRQNTYMSTDLNNLNIANRSGDDSASMTSVAFTYERKSTHSTFKRDRELGEISMKNNTHQQRSYTKPINV